MKTIIPLWMALLTFAIPATGATGVFHPEVSAANIAPVLSPTIIITVNNNAVCHSDCNGSATAGISGGLAPYTYSWSTGDTTASVSTLCAGTHSCTVTDANGEMAGATVTISQPSLLTGAISVIAQPGCQGGTNGVIEVSCTGGTTPYTCHWTSGELTTVLSGLSVGSYTCVVSDSVNCTSVVTVLLSEDASTDLYGSITLQGSNLGSGYAYAIKHESTSVSNRVDTVGQVVIAGGATGSYLFPDLPAGNYLLKIMLDTIEHPTHVPSYYGGAFQWDSSMVFTHGCMQTDTADIEMLILAQDTGSGIISGHILEGPGYANLWLLPDGSPPNIPYVPGRPLKRMDVKLAKKSGGIAACTLTDANGYYVFNNVANGDYFIFLDIPNLPMDTLREVNIGPGSFSSFDNDYTADSLQIFTEEEPVGIYASSKNYGNGFRIYPNPSSDVMNLQFSVTEEQYVSMEICKADGSLVRNIAMQEGKGDHTLQLSARELQLAAGVYFLSLVSEKTKYTQRIVVID